MNHIITLKTELPLQTSVHKLRQNVEYKATGLYKSVYSLMYLHDAHELVIYYDISSQEYVVYNYFHNLHSTQV